jgi:hypothetical protein
MQIRTLVSLALVFLVTDILAAPPYAGIREFDLPGGSSSPVVALNDQRMLIGANSVDSSEPEGYLYDPHTGALIAFLYDPAPGGPTDGVGDSAALSENWAVLGAPLYDIDYAGYPPYTRIQDVGRALVYAADTGEFQRFIDNPEPITPHAGWGGSWFGKAVGAYGSKIIVGAPFWSSPDEMFRVGRAYIFDSATGNLLQTLQHPDPDAYDNFGTSVAINGDLALVGAPRAPGSAAPGSDSGIVYVFSVSTGQLLGAINNPGGVTAYPGGVSDFGLTLSLHDSKVLIGAYNKAFLYDAESRQLLRTFDNPGVPGKFGSAVSLSADHALIGAHNDNAHPDGNRRGRAYLIDSATGNVLQVFDPPQESNHYFGLSVGLLADRAVITAGAGERLWMYKDWYEAENITIDFDPWSATNEIRTKDTYFFALQINTTSVVDGDAYDFDASTVDPASLVVGPGLAPNVAQTILTADYDNDGDTDYIFAFRVHESGVNCLDTTITLLGRTLSGDPIVGRDTIVPINCEEVVEMDVEPWNTANEVRPNDSYTVPVGIMTTSVAAGDAVNIDVSQIDPASLKFGPNLVPHVGGVITADLDGDLDNDAVFGFNAFDSGIACDDTELNMEGKLYSGQPIIGVDAIVTTECTTGGCHP